MKAILSAITLAVVATVTSGCLDNSLRSQLADYCPAAEKAIAFYEDWDDLVPAAYRLDVFKAASTSKYICANRDAITARDAFDAGADLYRSLEIARKYAPTAAAWQGNIKQFDSLMRRAREAGLK